MPVLLSIGAIPGLTPLSAGTSALVALLAIAFAALAARAATVRANPGLRWVALAFAVFGAKNVFSAYNVLAHERPGWPNVAHDALELVLSLFDLAIMLLLFAPLLLRRRG